jgi:TRAP transporter TAXI family solute receptor
MNKYVPEANISVAETGGGTDNVNRIALGDLDGSFVGSFNLYRQKYLGETKRFKGKSDPNLRVFSGWTKAASFLFVRADSGVTKLEDLNGRVFSGGAPGTGSDANTKAGFAALGIKPKWFLGSVKDAIVAIKDGRCVGRRALGPGGQLDSGTMDVNSTTPIRILSFTEEQLKLWQGAVSGTARLEVPAGTIKSLPEHGPILTGCTVMASAISKDIPEDTVYKWMKALSKHWDDVIAAYVGASNFEPATDTLKYASEHEKCPPLHAGVVKYMQDQGFQVPSRLIPPEFKK